MNLKQVIDDKLQNGKAYESVTGWVTPRKTVILVDLFNHLKALKEHPELLSDEIKGFIEEKEEYLDDVWQGCADLEEEEGHGEWHSYEMAESDVQGEIMCKLYKSGFLRFFIRLENKKSQTFGNNQLYANVTLEGMKLQNFVDLITYLQNKYRVELKTERINEKGSRTQRRYC